MSKSENGWEPSHAGADILEWITVPGTNVTLQVMKGWPSAIMRAYAADYNAYVEPLRDADSASFTPTNSVATSNHLNGTAMDLNWNSHPFQVSNAGYSPQMIATMREILDFYEGTMFWAQDWNSPKDCMHHQLGYNTWNNPHTGDFIARKIRADGFSTFRRVGVPVPPLPPPTLSRAERYALLIIAEGRRLGITPRGIQIALSVALVETNLTMYANSNDPPSLNFPHDAVGSDHMSSGLFQQQTSWGSLADRMDATKSATIFFTVDHGAGVRGLTKIRKRINGRDGDLWDYNDTSRSPGFYAQTVQGSAYPDRYDERFNDAVALYNRLSGAQPIEEGFLMALSDAEQREVLENARRQSRPRPSKSPLRPPGEGDIGDMNDVVGYIDGSIHWLAVRSAAELGHPKYLDLLQRVAADPTRPDDANLAQAILADIESKKAQPQAVSAPQAAPQPQVVYLPAPQPLAAAETASTGQTIGAAYDALESLRLADALPIEGRAPLAALIAVLQTKNGSNV